MNPTWKTTSGFAMQSMQTPEMTLVRKKGIQQMMKTPITVPSVLAAFFSLANLDTFFEMENVLSLELAAEEDDTSRHLLLVPLLHGI
jgi:hypothetical protein